ncbi:MAG: 16S rRNA (cytosine(967)-C(5))-methyltransferase RsmB [Lachnospiraceae bacterium]|nr:16S rRNA (cytosine(967)-C(5))-methyltransferase RsmB [Lachnospiraceae bacterium]
MEQVNVRQLVMEMLLSVTKDGEYSHIVIRDVQSKYNYLGIQEKAFMKRLFEGTLERMIELDYCIDQFSKVKVQKMKPVIRTIMRMGAYQILYMNSVPDSAACNEAVKLAQKKGFHTLKGFVNGVLRNLSREKDKIVYPDMEKEFIQYACVKYSMPEWIVRLWEQQLGRETTLQVLEGLLKEHPVTVRMRTQDKAQIEAVNTALTGQGGRMKQHPYLDYAYVIEKTDDMSELPGYEQGAFVVQDVSSMLAVEALGIPKGSRVLDICAAPGGKSMLAADILMRQSALDGSVEARDISGYKVDLMQENFDRCGLNCARAVVWDALEQDDAWIEQADVVIADVPCSGLGIIGKKRDIKYKMTPEAVAEIVKLQEDILRRAVAYVKPGGRLLFSTCTINRQENEAHVRWLQEELGMTPVSLAEALPRQVQTKTAKEGYVQLLPGIHETDGFFISVFCKK